MDLNHAPFKKDAQHLLLYPSVPRHEQTAVATAVGGDCDGEEKASLEEARSKHRLKIIISRLHQ